MKQVEYYAKILRNEERTCGICTLTRLCMLEGSEGKPVWVDSHGVCPYFCPNLIAIRRVNETAQEVLHQLSSAGKCWLEEEKK